MSAEATQRPVNRLELAAEKILALITELRNPSSTPDIHGLQALAVEEIKTFKARALHLQVNGEVVQSAHHVLCSTLDEVVLNTPWGHESTWNASGLTARFWQNDLGGDRFFQLLEVYRKEPTLHLEILELMYICLSLGFMGKYRLLDNGRSRLDGLREKLYSEIHQIRQGRGEDHLELSPQWRGVSGEQRLLPGFTGLWLSASAVALVLLAIFGFFKMTLEPASTAVAQDLLALRLDSVGRAPPPVSAPPCSFDLPEELGKVECGDQVTVVRLLAGLFDSGVDQPNQPEMIRRIARTLKESPGSGDILVKGHTDSAGSLQSNWDLSWRRAENVARLLAGELGGGRRIRYQGFGETEPLCDNSTWEGRACNRRVEITIHGSQGASS